MQKCNSCAIEKHINDFQFIKTRNRHLTICRKCRNKKRRSYYDKEKAHQNYLKNANNPEFKKKRKIQSRVYYESNRDSILVKVANYRENNIDVCKKYRHDNKLKINERRKISERKRMKSDMAYKLRKYTSIAIRNVLANKSNQSILQFLPYTMDELKNHIESQFEPWMNWQNWGKYQRKTWNDNDLSTWTWQIDHIIPQSLLPYSSMDEENFKRCWSLENLRPYSAKQNQLDGCTQNRGRSLCPSSWMEAKKCEDVEELRLQCNAPKDTK